jgi:hypothetical protein
VRYEQLTINEPGIEEETGGFVVYFQPEKRKPSLLLGSWIWAYLDKDGSDYLNFAAPSLAAKSLVTERAARLQHPDFERGGKRALAYHQGVCLHNLGLQSRSKLFDQVRVITVVHRDRNLGLELS